jgi:hypothetical protein
MQFWISSGYSVNHMLAKITSQPMKAFYAVRCAVYLMSVCSFAHARQPDPVRPADPIVTRVAGTEPSSKIQYVRLILAGTIVRSKGETASASPAPDSAGTPVARNVASPGQAPQLTAQCTRTASGKQGFELFANFGGIADTDFYPPWKPASSSDLFPPRLDKYKFTMEFLGYTRVKPVKREFEAVLQPTGQYRYNNPSGGSSNMEDITYYLRFLLALPTLRLTLAPHSVEFLTTPLLNEIRKEPLCKASLL